MYYNIDVCVVGETLHEKRSRNWPRVSFAPAVTREGHMSCGRVAVVSSAFLQIVQDAYTLLHRENKPRQRALLQFRVYTKESHVNTQNIIILLYT